MKEAFLKNSINFIQNNNGELSEEEKEKLAYGLEGLYLTFSKLIIINVIALILGIWKEFFFSLILFNVLRFPGFGFHANNSLTCLISSTILLIGIPYLFLTIPISFSITFILCIFCNICFLLYAPADTEKRPLTNKKKRIYRKIAASSLSVLYSIVILCIKDNSISMLFLSGLVLETILILPITYKFYGVPYKNYLKV